MKLEGMPFPAPSRLVSEVREILDEICMTKSVKVLDEWEFRLRSCIDSGGKYVPNGLLKFGFY
jgi:hypothetical protein